MKKLLVIDDDPIVHSLFRSIFEQSYEVTCEITGQDGLRELNVKKFDFCVIDLKLSDMYGIDLFKKIKEVNVQPSCIFMILTAVESVDAEIEGHELGITEYIKKPIVPRLLKAIFDKYSSQRQAGEEVCLGPLKVNLKQMVVYYDDILVELTNSEFRILHHLVTNVGAIFSREELYHIVTRKPGDQVDRSIDMHVSSLRKKIKSAGNYIRTKRGKGYVLDFSQ